MGGLVLLCPERISHLYFIGGIFGAGKSTLCQTLASELPAEHLKASELLRYRPDPGDMTGKATSQVLGNQERLVAVLAAHRSVCGTTVLDGHFCLLDNAHTVIRVPEYIFRCIQPNALVLVECAMADILDRIRKRNGTCLDPILIQQLAQTEREHALAISRFLDIPIMNVDASTNVEKIISFLRAS